MKTGQTNRNHESLPAAMLAATADVTLAERLIHAIHHPVWIADCSGSILNANQAASQVYGFRHSEWFGLDMQQVFCPDNAELYRHSLQEVLRDGYTYFCSNHRRRDHSTFSGELRIQSFEFGDETRLIITGNDISDLEHASLAVQESKNRFKRIFDCSATGIVTILPEGYFLQTNQAFCKLVGLSQEQLTQGPITDLVFRDDLDEFQHCLIRNGTNEPQYLTLRLVNANGEPFWVTISIAWATGSGYAILLVQDVDAYRNMELALRSGEAKYRSVIETVSDAIIQLDNKGLLRYANQAWETVIGSTTESSLGRPLESFTTTEHLKQVRRLVRQLLLGQTLHASGEFIAQHPNKSETWVEANLQAISDKDGKLFISGTIKDISKRKAATAMLEEERSFLQTVIDGVIDPILVIDLDRKVRMMNQAARQSNHTQPSRTGHLYCYQAYFNSDAPCHGSSHPCPLEEVLQSGLPSSVVHCLTDDDGEQRIFQVQASPWLDRDGKPQGLIESVRDITGLFEAEAKLREKELHMNYLAEFDGLTHLPNRQFFFRCLQQSMQRANRSGHQVAILQLDLDRFKNINDNLGHKIGDQILKIMADRLRTTLRDNDLIARLADDEFAIILEQVKEVSNVGYVAGKVIKAISPQIDVDGYQLYVTASIGISVYPDDAEDIESLLRMSDKALNRVKEQGRNSYQFFTPDMADRSGDRLLLEHSFRKAIDVPQLVLHYQPQLDLYTGHLKGMEALVRWQHPEKGMISPGDFIPLAEETGLVVPMGEWVLREACRQNVRWLEQGCWPIRMTVNISARQFLQTDLVRTVRDILEETGLPPGLLELEITESMIMSDIDASTSIMHEVADMGVHLAIDDFGTGYSSLAHLKRFPLSTLKIDRAFVMDVNDNQEDAAIVNSIIVLAHNLNLQVIAEGIETEDQYLFLKEIGCEIGQGFLFSRPQLPAELGVFFRWLERRIYPLT